MAIGFHEPAGINHRRFRDLAREGLLEARSYQMVPRRSTMLNSA